MLGQAGRPIICFISNFGALETIADVVDLISFYPTHIFVVHLWTISKFFTDFNAFTDVVDP